jgi:type II secretory pathway component PulM
MGESRIENALARIEAAMERIVAARATAASAQPDPAASARVSALVNSHEQLREEVAETMRELDALIEDLEA